jgi:2-oxo-4-hydroxy-4-carboxy-5-ureidoimidazoline decarboxylase
MTSRSSALPGYPEPDPLARFNGLPPDEAVSELLSCCASATWARSVASGRPYAGPEAGLRRSDEAVAELTLADLADALAGHPRIGADDADRSGGRRTADPAARSARFSCREQSGVRAAGAGAIRSLAGLNRDYEQRFGHIYLVCAAGRSAAELTGVLRHRLGNDAQTEWLVVRSELQKINRIRLGDLLAGAP